MSEYDDIIGQLTQFRLDQEWSLSQGARRFNISKSKLNNWEKGANRPAYEDLQAWAEGYGKRVTMALLNSNEEIVVQDIADGAQEETPPAAVQEVLAAIEALPEERVSEVARFARIIGQLAPEQVQMLLVYIRGLERDIVEADTSGTASRNG